MGAVIIPLLVLLFSMCGAQSRSTQASHSDVSVELQEVRDMVSELKVMLQNTKAENDAKDTELTAMRTELKNLKMETAAQEAELTTVKTRLAATETNVVNLEKEITEQPKVAFSAGLTNSGYVESGDTDLKLVFSRIITNVGEAYSGTTGYFKAPVRGVYYFRFTVMDHITARGMTVRMFKNDKPLMRLFEYDDVSSIGGDDTHLSSGVALQLEVGDVVNMRLPAGYRLFDNFNNHSTFSGFLLFPL